MEEAAKPRYMIGVVSQLLGVHPQTLRFYEREGLIGPGRTKGNTRLYSEVDVEQMRMILRLTRDLGINLAGVEVILHMRRQMERMQREMEALARWAGRGGPHAVVDHHPSDDSRPGKRIQVKIKKG